MNFQNQLIETRKKRKMSREDLSNQTGVSCSAIAHYEHGGQPTLQKADALLTALGISMTIGKTTKETPPTPLTAEELQSMANKPYYHVSLTGNENKWIILDSWIAARLQDYKYGETWLAYDRET